MPIQDNYLILSSAQTVLSTGSTASNSPFDTGQQISSLYGQSPYATSNKNTIAATLGQAPKKFFFMVRINYGASGGSTANTMTIALMQGATAGATGRTVSFQTAALTKPSLTTAASAILCKIPLPEPLLRYINGKYTMTQSGSSYFTAFKVDAELTLY